MKIGLQIPWFTWPGGASEIGRTLAKIARTADQGGFDLIGVMDHFFQIGSIAMLGIGAGWNEYEAKSLGIPFPPVPERFDWLEDTLRLCLQMWNGDESRLEGKRFVFERPLNSPQSLTRPHPRIMIGGMGEQKTLRLVAKYADACNLFPTPQVAHKLDVLKRHCEREKRNYDDIEKTTMYRFDIGDRGENVGKLVEQLRGLSRMGFATAIGGVKDVWKITPLEIMARELIPAVAAF